MTTTTKAPKKAPNPNKKYNYSLMIAHLCDDLNQGGLVAVMPFLVLHNGYSYAEVTALCLLYTSDAADE